MVIKTGKLNDNIIYTYRNNEKDPVYLAVSIYEGKAQYESNRFNFHSRDGLGWTRIKTKEPTALAKYLSLYWAR